MLKAAVAAMVAGVGAANEVIPVQLNYWNTDGRVKPGMFCEALWPTRRSSPSLFVPSTSVAVTTYDSFVDKIEHGIVKWVKVKPGQTIGKWVEVFGDLREGDMISITGTDELREGKPIKPVIKSKDETDKDPVSRLSYNRAGNGVAVNETGRFSSSYQDKQANEQ